MEMENTRKFMSPSSSRQGIGFAMGFQDTSAMGWKSPSMVVAWGKMCFVLVLSRNESDHKARATDDTNSIFLHRKKNKDIIRVTQISNNAFWRDSGTEIEVQR
jgi:hypothetical protein